eukprot:c3894_g1_i1.p1 GENE.c3894_g1_i1~~c3894_g1_i1.p1  ORF type:complete len:281 (+),score=44.41 c3894_g1_i1:459-1301(+)
MRRHQGKFWARFPLGESCFDVCQRVQILFSSIMRDRFGIGDRKSTDVVIVVSHGITIRSFVMMWCHLTPEWFDKSVNPPNCSVRVIDSSHPSRDRGYIFGGWDKGAQVDANELQKMETQIRARHSIMRTKAYLLQRGIPTPFSLSSGSEFDCPLPPYKMLNNGRNSHDMDEVLNIADSPSLSRSATDEPQPPLLLRRGSDSAFDIIEEDFRCSKCSFHQVRAQRENSTAMSCPNCAGTLRPRSSSSVDGSPHRPRSISMRSITSWMTPPVTSRSEMFSDF